MAQRIEGLRKERNLSAPALSAALGFPRMAIEKFETGRQTPSQEQQEKMAAYLGVSVFYLRGESNDRTQMEDWMDGAFLDVESVVPAPKQAPKPQPLPAGGEGTLFDSFLNSKRFQESLRGAVLEALRSPEGQELLAQVLRRERSDKK